MLQCVAVRCSVLQCFEVCCSVLQCVAVCCSVIQERLFKRTQCAACACMFPFVRVLRDGVSEACVKGMCVRENDRMTE